MRTRSWRAVSPVAAAAAVLLLTAPAPPAAAAGTWRTLPATEAPSGSGLAACLAEAERRRPDAWTCSGGELTITVVDERGTRPKRVQVVDNTPIDTTRQVRAAADDYDTWCESGTICTRKISNYTVEVKGNGAYGDSRGAIGAFDQVMRQSFNGGNPRWRMLLDYDTGPAVNGFDWHTRCRKSDAFSDSVCGDNPYDPATISSASPRTWFPSSTGLVVNSQVLSGSTNKYHDENYGAFKASGYTQTFYTGVLHTGRWNKCGACIYYQVPWTSSP